MFLIRGILEIRARKVADSFGEHFFLELWDFHKSSKNENRIFEKDTEGRRHFISNHFVLYLELCYSNRAYCSSQIM